MNILYSDSEFCEKLQPLYHSIFCLLNYTHYLVLSDLAMQSLFNDDFLNLLWALMWVGNSDCIQAPVTISHSEEGRWGDRQTERPAGVC